jgi:hypothetical protein
MMIFRRIPDGRAFPAKSGKARLRGEGLRDAARCGWFALDELAVDFLDYH